MSPVLSDPAQPAQGLAVLLLLMARMAPLAALVPWLASPPAIAGTTLIGTLLTLALSVALWPVALAGAPTLPTSLMWLALLSVRELLLGAVLAVGLALPLLSLRWAGALVDRARGVPTLELDAELLGQLLMWIGMVAFFAVGGHRVAIAALSEVLTAHPVGQLVAPSDPAALALGSARLLSDSLAAALLAALPALAALLIAELALGLSLRLSDALPLAALLPGGRAALGLAVVWVSAAFVLYSLPSAFEQSLSAASRLWQSL